MTADMKGKRCYLFFSGYCMTAFAAETLNGRDVPCRIVKAPISMRRSCSFALLISYEDMDRAISVLNGERIIVVGREISE